MSMATITIEPVSAQTHPWGLPRHYGPERPDTTRQKNGDQALLAALEQAIGRHAAVSMIAGSAPGSQTPVTGPLYGSPAQERPTVAELPISELEDVILGVEMRVDGWHLTGEEGQPILERLDEHFRPLQEAWAEHRREEDERRERLAREQQQRAEQEGRLWRRHRLTEMVSEAAAMGGVEELRELLDERAALEGAG
jgi:hypothetical protein